MTHVTSHRQVTNHMTGITIK